MKQLIINGLSIELEKKRIKNMYLRVLPPDGRIYISAPLRMKDGEIERFVLSRLDWILLQQSKMMQRNITKELEYVTGEEILVWGIGYKLLVQEAGGRSFISISGERLVLNAKKGSTLQQRKKVLNDWYRNNLEHALPELLNKWEGRIGVKASGFCIRDMKTRWGTCNVRSANICFNLQLAKKPPVCVEYVVVHELVHLLERSHNHVFKAYMDKFLPDWRTIKKRLNNTIS